MEKIVFTQEQINDLYAFVQQRAARFVKRGKRSNRVTSSSIETEVTEHDLFLLVRANSRYIGELIEPLAPVINGDSIVYKDSGDDDIDDDDDDDEFEELPSDPMSVIQAAQLLLFVANYGVHSICSEVERVARLKASARAKLTAEELKVLGLE